MAEYTLPDLDYDYGGLEPHISGQINEIRHSKHHATYVKGLNDAIAKLEEAQATGDHAAIFLNGKNLAFHLGGHVNHSIWWKKADYVKAFWNVVNWADVQDRFSAAGVRTL